MRAAAESLRELGAVVEDVSVPLHELGPALWTAIAIEGMAETVLRNQGFAFGRDDHYPTDLMQHLFDRRRHGRAARPANVLLFTLVGRYVDAQQGRLNYARAVNRTRTLRAAYDEALARFDVLVTPTTPQTARPLPAPDARRRRRDPGRDRDVVEHHPVQHHPPPCAQRAVRDGRRASGRAAARRAPLRRGHAFRVGRAIEQN